MLSLPYGRVPDPLDLGNRVAHVLEAPALPPQRPVEELLESALSAPIGASIPDASHVTIIVSDITRDEPRPAFLRALRRRLPHARCTIAVATGTHGPMGDLTPLGLPSDVERVIDHDGHSDRDLTLGTTPYSTPVRVHVHRCLVETDLVIATGCIKPHDSRDIGSKPSPAPAPESSTTIYIGSISKTRIACSRYRHSC